MIFCPLFTKMVRRIFFTSFIKTINGTWKHQNADFVTGVIESTEGLEINSVHIREPYEWQLELEKEAQTNHHGTKLITEKVLPVWKN